MAETTPRIRRLITKEQVVEKLDAERQLFAPPQVKTSPVVTDDIYQALNSNQDGDARLYIQLHGDHFRFDHAAGRWYEWGGHFWVEDQVDEALAAIEGVIELYAKEAEQWAIRKLNAARASNGDEQTRAAKIESEYLKRLGELQNLKRKTAVLRLAATGKKSLGIDGTEWDQKSMLLACLNGVVDLRTGQFSAGRQEDYLKTACPTQWKGMEAPCSEWGKFLIEIFDGDSDLVAYIQRLLGYGITGLTTDHIFPVFYGVGRNGKGTLLETLADVLGPLAGPIKSEMLLQQDRARHSNAPDSDIMALRGKRLVWASETNEGRALNEGKVKWLVGGDTLVGRDPYGKRQVSFSPTHKLILLTNHKPQIRSHSLAIWERIHLVPFNIQFIDNPSRGQKRRDPHLIEKLKAEASGILAWLVQGCMEWQSGGLDAPEIVKAATREYREDEDILGRFISDECIEDSEAQIQAGLLYQSYQDWCETNGHNPMSATTFGKKMKERYKSEKTTHVIYYGIKLKGSPSPPSYTPKWDTRSKGI